MFGLFGHGVQDHVVLSVTPDAPEPRFEVHCHGGVLVVDWVLEQLAAAGAAVVPWLDLEFGPSMGLRARATDALTKAPTLRTAAILIDQAQGAFTRAIQRVLDLFAESRINAAASAMDRLLRWSALGRRLVSPWKVAVCGPVNAGKSSLVNALAGYERVVVNPLPGTTRDVVTTRMAFHGWPVEIADTAGVREADGLEAAGIELGRRESRSADLILWTLDASAPPTPPPSGATVVVNKVDLGLAWEPDRFGPAVLVSAVTGAGIADLVDTVARRLVPDAPSAGEAVPFTPELVEKLQEARGLLARGQAGAARSLIAELLQPARSAADPE